MNHSKPFNQYPWWIILNPVAGNGKAAKKKSAIEQLLVANGFDFHLVESQHQEHAIKLVIEGIKDGYRHIMGIGGDGTNNEIINGILQQQIVPPTEIVYTLLPIGTGNDWIKTHNIPNNWRKWVPRIAQGKTILHDIGLLFYMKNGKQQKRYFINVAGLAYDAYIAQEKEAHPGQIFPKLYYLWMVARYLFKYHLRKASIQFNNITVTDRFYTINIGICRYSGGGMQLVPHANPTDGQLALTIAGPVQKVDILLYTPNIFAGTLHRHPKVAIYQTKKIAIRAEEDSPTLLEADGEFLGETPVDCSIVEKVLTILIPR